LGDSLSEVSQTLGDPIKKTDKGGNQLHYEYGGIFMLAKKEWLNIFDEYKSYYLYFDTNGELLEADKLLENKIRQTCCNLDIMSDADLKRPLLAIFLSDLSKVWVYAYDHFYVLERDMTNSQRMYAAVKIEYINIKDIQNLDDKNELSISEKRNNTVYTVCNANLSAKVRDIIANYLYVLHEKHINS